MAYNAYKSSSSLAQQLYENQRSLAEQQMRKDTSSLQEQLRQQRANMQISRQQLGEQGWATNRAITQQAQARGLGSSGMQNLSLIQNQLAQGKSLDLLEKENVDVQKAAMSTRGSISQDYLNAIKNADITYAQAMDAAGQKKQETLAALYDAALNGADAATIANMATLYGIDLDSMTSDEKTALLSSAGNPEGGLTFKDMVDWERIAASTSLAAGSGALVGGPLGAPVGALGGFLGGLVSEAFGGKNMQGKIEITDGSGNKMAYDNWDSAVAAVKQRYSGMQYSQFINVVRVGNGIKFTAPNSSKKYSTYNEALAAYKASLSGTKSEDKE
jgi:hypothetical protein